MAATDCIKFGRNVTNTYRAVTDEYTLLNIKNDHGVYNFTTVVDTRLVKDLSKFTWNRNKTPSGFYFSTSLSDVTWRHMADLKIAHKQHSDTLLLHRFIAFLVDIPNEDPDNATYVDHVNRQPLDNRVKNLRWATQSLQNTNRGKRKRQHNATPLPTDINVTELPVYMQWRCESEKRKFFVIERHPVLMTKNTTWSSSKSQKVSNQKKFEEAMQKLAEFDKMIDADPEKDMRDALLAEYDAVSVL